MFSRIYSYSLLFLIIGYSNACIRTNGGHGDGNGDGNGLPIPTACDPITAGTGSPTLVEGDGIVTATCDGEVLLDGAPGPAADATTGMSTIDLICTDEEWIYEDTGAPITEISCSTEALTNECPDCTPLATGAIAPTITPVDGTDGCTVRATCDGDMLFDRVAGPVADATTGMSTAELTCNAGDWEAGGVAVAEVACTSGAGAEGCLDCEPIMVGAGTPTIEPVDGTNGCTVTATCDGDMLFDGKGGPVADATTGMSTAEFICNAGTWEAEAVAVAEVACSSGAGAEECLNCTPLSTGAIAPIIVPVDGTGGCTVTATCDGNMLVDGAPGPVADATGMSTAELTCNAGDWESGGTVVTEVSCSDGVGADVCPDPTLGEGAPTTTVMGDTVTVTCTGDMFFGEVAGPVADATTGESTIDLTCVNGAWDFNGAPVDTVSCMPPVTSPCGELEVPGGMTAVTGNMMTVTCDATTPVMQIDDIFIIPEGATGATADLTCSGTTWQYDGTSVTTVDCLSNEGCPDPSTILTGDPTNLAISTPNYSPVTDGKTTATCTGVTIIFIDGAAAGGMLGQIQSLEIICINGVWMYNTGVFGIYLPVLQLGCGGIGG